MKLDKISFLVKSLPSELVRQFGVANNRSDYIKLFNLIRKGEDIEDLPLLMRKSPSKLRAVASYLWQRIEKAFPSEEEFIDFLIVSGEREEALKILQSKLALTNTPEEDLLLFHQLKKVDLTAGVAGVNEILDELGVENQADNLLMMLRSLVPLLDDQKHHLVLSQLKEKSNSIPFSKYPRIEAKRLLVKRMIAVHFRDFSTAAKHSRDRISLLAKNPLVLIREHFILARILLELDRSQEARKTIMTASKVQSDSLATRLERDYQWSLLILSNCTELGWINEAKPALRIGVSLKSYVAKQSPIHQQLFFLAGIKASIMLNDQKAFRKFYLWGAGIPDSSMPLQVHFYLFFLVNCLHNSLLEDDKIDQTIAILISDHSIDSKIVKLICTGLQQYFGGQLPRKKLIDFARKIGDLAEAEPHEARMLLPLDYRRYLLCFAQNKEFFGSKSDNSASRAS